MWKYTSFIIVTVIMSRFAHTCLVMDISKLARAKRDMITVTMMNDVYFHTVQQL